MDASADFSAASQAAYRPWSEAALELRGVVVAGSSRERGVSRPAEVSEAAAVGDAAAPALDQRPLDLIVRRGELTLHVAPSAHAVAEVAAGLRTPAAGEVLWFGEPVTGIRPAALARRRRGRIAWLPAESSVVPHLTVLENLLLPAVATRTVPESLDRADELLAEFGLAEVARHPARELAGDEAAVRRLELARALLPAPIVLVAVLPPDGDSGDHAHSVALARNPDGALSFNGVRDSRDPLAAPAAHSASPEAREVAADPFLALLRIRAANGLAVLVARTAPVEG